MDLDQWVAVEWECHSMTENIHLSQCYPDVKMLNSSFPSNFGASKAVTMCTHWSLQRKLFRLPNGWPACTAAWMTFRRTALWSALCGAWEWSPFPRVSLCHWMKWQCSCCLRVALELRKPLQEREVGNTRDNCEKADISLKGDPGWRSIMGASLAWQMAVRH